MSSWYIAALIFLALAAASLVYGFTLGSKTTTGDDYGGLIGGMVLCVVFLVLGAAVAFIGLALQHFT